MEETVVEIKTNPIKVETLRILKGKCSLASPYLNPGPQYYNQCLQCPYFIAKQEGGSCGWYEYRTQIIEQESHTEEDEFGTDTPTDYFTRIKCAYCGSPITFYSSFSTLTKGNEKRCPECGLLHTFITTEKK